jgi:hypothetical protein
MLKITRDVLIPHHRWVKMKLLLYHSEIIINVGQMIKSWCLNGN